MNKRLLCRDCVEFLDDYLDGQLKPDVRAKFESHLAQCPPCRDYLKTYQDTIRLGHSLCDDQEATVPEALVKAILAAREKS